MPLWQLRLVSGIYASFSSALGGDPFPATEFNLAGIKRLATAMKFDGAVFDEVER